MAKPRLKPGDTFVFTKEMWKAADKTFPKFNIGQMMEVTRVYENWYQLCGLYYPLFDWIDPFLPETNPRTLDDVKEGDELEELTFKDREIVIGRSGGAVMTSPKSTSTVVNVRSLDYIKKNYKFADQPEERWKPEDNEKVWTVLSSCKVARVPFSESWQAEYEMGNIFKTREEAKQAAEEVKEFWRNRINNQKLK